jgi:hypothetical protein
MTALLLAGKNMEVPKPEIAEANRTIKSGEVVLMVK